MSGGVLPCVAGDLVNLPGEHKAYAVESCGGTSGAAIAFACLTCRQLLANETQLGFHLEAFPDQTHVIARQCPGHGWEAE